MGPTDQDIGRHHQNMRRGDAVRTLAAMDLRIGVTQSPREVSVELPDDTDSAALRTQVDAALTGAVDVLWLTDKKGRQIAVASAKIAYVEIGTAEGDRKIGFGG
jgi:Protein of unknown function (DUF3107)